MEDRLTETWHINNRINLYLLNGIAEESLGSDMAGKGRTVFALFAHTHNVRLMWLKSAAPDLLEGLPKIEPKPITNKSDLENVLKLSGDAVGLLIERAIADGGRVKGFKPDVVGFVAYLISHESHHRGQVEWALRLSGTPLDDKISFGLWEWGTR